MLKRDRPPWSHGADILGDNQGDKKDKKGHFRVDNCYWENDWGNVVGCAGTVKGGLYEEVTIERRLVVGTSQARIWRGTLQTEGTAAAKP